VVDEILVIHHHNSDELKRMETLMIQYQDVPMDLADASLVAMAEVLNQRQIFTLDSDFYIYRRYGNQPFEVVP
jgi:hypothetical protein